MIYYIFHEHCTVQRTTFTLLSLRICISDSVDINITLAVLKRSVNLIYMLNFSYFFFFSIESRSMKHFQPRDFGRNYEKLEVFRITIFLKGENVMIF